MPLNNKVDFIVWWYDNFDMSSFQMDVAYVPMKSSH